MFPVFNHLKTLFVIPQLANNLLKEFDFSLQYLSCPQNLRVKQYQTCV